MKQKLYIAIAQTINAYQKNQNDESRRDFFILNRENIFSIEKNLLPSGSGIDNGCRINIDKSTGEKIVIDFEYHHMDENGFYDGWTHHSLTIKASLMYDIELKIDGKDKNGVKDYLYQIFSDTLESFIEYSTIDNCYKFTEAN